MKKIIAILAIFIWCIGSVIAQSNYKLVKGYVVDKNGTPIPGAEVMVPGGGESVITDADGSFKLNVHPLLKRLTASYDGMTTKSLKIKPDKDIVFTLKKERKNPAFLNVLYGYSCNIKGDGYYFEMSAEATHWFSVGIMAGMLGKWGFYGKVNYDPYGNFSTTVGAIKSIYKRKVFVYTGTGYGMAWRYYDFMYNNMNTQIWCGDESYRPGITTDFGFIFKTGRHFNLTIGYNLICTFPFTGYNHHTGLKDVSVGFNYVHGVQAGIGYVF